MATKTKRKPRKSNPLRLYQVGIPYRTLLEVSLQATSRRAAVESAKQIVAKRKNPGPRYVKRVA